MSSFVNSVVNTMSGSLYVTATNISDEEVAGRDGVRPFCKMARYIFVTTPSVSDRLSGFCKEGFAAKQEAEDRVTDTFIKSLKKHSSTNFCELNEQIKVGGRELVIPNGGFVKLSTKKAWFLWLQRYFQLEDLFKKHCESFKELKKAINFVGADSFLIDFALGKVFVNFEEGVWRNSDSGVIGKLQDFFEADIGALELLLKERAVLNLLEQFVSNFQDFNSCLNAFSRYSRAHSLDFYSEDLTGFDEDEDDHLKSPSDQQSEESLPAEFSDAWDSESSRSRKDFDSYIERRINEILEKIAHSSSRRNVFVITPEEADHLVLDPKFMATMNTHHLKYVVLGAKC